MTVVASKYNIELRDKDGNLKKYLTPWADRPSWEWNSVGGCGRASITIQGDYRRIKTYPDDDIQIRIKSGSTTKLVYRGYALDPVPTLSDKESIGIECQGYSDKLSRYIVHDDNSEKIYTNEDIASIVADIIDTFVTPYSGITKGTIDPATYAPNELRFKTDAAEALRTLATLEGDIDWGVDEDLVFFWRKRSSGIRRKWLIGGKVTLYEPARSDSDIVNVIRFQGGDVDGSPLEAVLQSNESISYFGRREKSASNSAIVTSDVAARYISALLRQQSIPQYKTRAIVKNINGRLEDTLPIGKIAFIDPADDRVIPVYGSVASGGTGTIYGKKYAGGSEHYYGGIFASQVDRIRYILSDEDGKFDIELTLGGNTNKQAEYEKRIELELQNLKQRTS